MNKRYLYIILSVLLVISLVSNFAFYDLWQQEKDKVSEVQQELNETNKQIEALNSNHEQEINKVASDFVERLFTYDPRVYVDGWEAALEVTIGEAKETLIKKRPGDQYEEFSNKGETTISLVNITDSVYNKTGNDTAEVVVQFDQELIANIKRTKAINKIKLWMRWIENGWKIENYKIIEVI